MRCLLTIILIYFTCKVSCQGVETTPSKINSFFKFSPSELISSTFMVEWEKLNLEQAKSFAVGLGLTYIEDSANEDAIGIKGELSRKIYLSGYNPKVAGKYHSGLYLGYYLRGGYEYLNHISQGNGSYKHKGFWVFPGVMIGYSRILFDRLVVEGFIGGGLKYVEKQIRDEYSYYQPVAHISPLDNAGVWGNVGLRIGLVLNRTE